MRNMLVLNLLLLVFAFPAPILFALLLNELGVGPFKKVTQTISYLPHFVSTVVIVGIMMKMFSFSGVVNKSSSTSAAKRCRSSHCRRRSAHST